MAKPLYQILIEKTGRKRKKLVRPPIIHNPDRVEREYFSDLKSILLDLKKITKENILPKLERIFSQANYLRPVEDDYADEIQELMKKVRIIFSEKNTDEKFKSIAKKNARKVEEFNAKEMDKVFTKVLGVNPFLSEPFIAQEVSAFTANNVKLIKDFSDDYLSKVEGIIQRGATSGKLTKDITSEIVEKLGVTESRAKTIARDQVSKFNSSLNKLRQQNLGVTKYEWSTAGDDAVRPSHAEKNGNIYSWDDPPSDTGNPGDDVNCRCIGLPVFDDEE